MNDLLQRFLQPIAVRTAIAVLCAGLVLGGCGGDDEHATPALEDADRVAYATSIILIQGKPKRAVAAARARIWELWKLVKNGTPFAEVAQQHSEDESRAWGGFVGFVPIGPDNAQSGAMQAMAPGSMSRPVKTLIGYQIFYRHAFDEAVQLERKLGMWIFGAYIAWGEPAGGRTKEQSRIIAERLMTQLKAGDVSLPDIIAKQGNDARVPLNGYLGHTYNRKGRRALFEPLSRVAEGEYAGPVDTQNGWALLQRGHSLRAVVKHILIQDNRSDLSIARTPAQAAALAKKLLDEAKASPGKWNRLVRDHSDDVSSRGQGGLLTTITPGAWDEAFEQAVRDTPPGQLAKAPVASEYGWHIIWRLK